MSKPLDVHCVIIRHGFVSTEICAEETYSNAVFDAQRWAHLRADMSDTSDPASPQLIYDDAEQFRIGAPRGRLIGIDAGTKTLGLALSDVERSIASGLTTLRRTKFSKDVVDLAALAETHQVSGWVLGLPANLDGSEGPRAQATRAFARNLVQNVPLPILLWDERLSTVAAERLLISSGASRKRRGEVIDKMAATLILQGALDRLRHVER